MAHNISVIIPYYESDPGKPEILKRLTSSLKGHNEIIIVWNDKMGYAKPINKGLSNANGDFLVVMNDDVILRRGTLQDLVNPMAVTSPMFNGRIQDFWGSCFCIPRWVYERAGGLYEGYRISYFDDDDYINTLRKNDIDMEGVEEVEFDHPEGGRTLHTFPNRDEFFRENENHFIKRWGRTPRELDEYYYEHGELPNV